MLPGIQGILACINQASDGSSSYDISYLGGDGSSGGPGSSQTIENFPLGTADADRRIFGVVTWTVGSSARTLDSLDIGVTAATIHVQRGHTGGISGMGVAIVSAIVTTGTERDIDATFSGSVNSAAFFGLRVVGLANSSPTDTDTAQTAGTSDDLNCSVNVAEGGLVLAGFVPSEFADSSPNWIGVNRESDRLAWISGVAADASYDVTADVSPATNSGNNMVVVSWL
jgi:hypothetical protein